MVAAAMVEIELKFQVPQEAAAALRKAVATRTVRTIAMHAIYYDTPDRRLSQSGIALRLRREGRRWVQTVKCSGAAAIERIEHDAAAGSARLPPPLDLARHAGTDAAPAVAAALGDDAAALQPVFETRVRRKCRIVRQGAGAIEVALDEGKIVAAGRELVVREIEFELMRGSVEALVAVAQRWVGQHGLWLDVRSKAERGDRLARTVEAGPVATSGAPKLDEAMSPPQALCAMVNAALAQVLPNAADLAGGVGSPVHLHQLRVGLRRLRTALRLFGDATDPRRARWESELQHLFSRLGTARDRDVLAASVLPLLQGAGAPWAGLPPPAAGDDPGAVLRQPETTRLLLELLAFAHSPAPAPRQRRR